MERPLEIAFRARSLKSMKNLAWAAVVLKLCHRERETDPRVRRFQRGYYGRDGPLQPGHRTGKASSPIDGKYQVDDRGDGLRRHLNRHWNRRRLSVSQPEPDDFGVDLLERSGIIKNIDGEHLIPEKVGAGPDIGGTGLQRLHLEGTTRLTSGDHDALDDPRNVRVQALKPDRDIDVKGCLGPSHTDRDPLPGQRIDRHRVDLQIEDISRGIQPH